MPTDQVTSVEVIETSMQTRAVVWTIVLNGVQRVISWAATRYDGAPWPEPTHLPPSPPPGGWTRETFAVYMGAVGTVYEEYRVRFAPKV